MFLLCANVQHALNVASEHVHLNIELSSGRDSAETRLLRRVRDDVDGEQRRIAGVLDRIDGERDTIDGREERGKEGGRFAVPPLLPGISVSPIAGRRQCKVPSSRSKVVVTAILANFEL